MVIDTLVSGIHDDWILIGLAYLLRFIVSVVNSSASIYILYICVLLYSSLMSLATIRTDLDVFDM